MHHEEDKWTMANPGRKRALGDDAVPARGHNYDHIPQDYRTINGWGADLDIKNRPSFPKELPSDVMNVRGDVEERQLPREKVHLSVEHPDLTPVFGASCPPHGLSGLLRDYAYQFGEGSNRHWLTLMLADRVDVLEHLVGDALRGEPDHYFEEKAWGTKLKYSSNRTGWIALGALAVGAVAIGVALRNRDRD